VTLRGTESLRKILRFFWVLSWREVDEAVLLASGIPIAELELAAPPRDEDRRQAPETEKRQEGLVFDESALAKEEGFERRVPFGTAVFKWVLSLSSWRPYLTNSTGRAV
jgi:hypothetical protein